MVKLSDLADAISPKQVFKQIASSGCPVRIRSFELCLRRGRRTYTCGFLQRGAAKSNHQTNHQPNQKQNKNDKI